MTRYGKNHKPRNEDLMLHPRRCGSWRPGDLMKCEMDEGHPERRHGAHARGNTVSPDRDLVNWVEWD